MYEQMSQQRPPMHEEIIEAEMKQLLKTSTKSKLLKKVG